MKHKEWAIPQSFLAVACAVLMLVFSAQIFAQAGIDTGNVTGTVMDQTGAIVQKAPRRRPFLLRPERTSSHRFRLEPTH